MYWIFAKSTNINFQINLNHWLSRQGASAENPTAVIWAYRRLGGSWKLHIYQFQMQVVKSTYCIYTPAVACGLFIPCMFAIQFYLASNESQGMRKPRIESSQYLFCGAVGHSSILILLVLLHQATCLGTCVAMLRKTIYCNKLKHGWVTHIKHLLI